MPWQQKANLRGPQGPQGPPGDPGPVGPAGLTWRGTWNNTTAYALNDSVGWGGSSYYTTGARTAGQPPPTGTAADPGVDDTALNAGWALLSVQGAQGPQGNPGTPGAPGSPGARGSKWFAGTGAPGTVVGSAAGDFYLDSNSGDVYELS